MRARVVVLDTVCNASERSSSNVSGRMLLSVCILVLLLRRREFGANPGVDADNIARRWERQSHCSQSENVGDEFATKWFYTHWKNWSCVRWFTVPSLATILLEELTSWQSGSQRSRTWTCAISTESESYLMANQTWLEQLQKLNIQMRRIFSPDSTSDRICPSLHRTCDNSPVLTMSQYPATMAVSGRSSRLAEPVLRLVRLHRGQHLLVTHADPVCRLRTGFSLNPTSGHCTLAPRARE